MIVVILKAVDSQEKTMERSSSAGKFSLIFPILFSSVYVRAQTFECTMQVEEESPCYQGDCDGWEYRDTYAPGETTPFLTIRLAFIVFRDGNGDLEAVSEASLEAQFVQLNLDFEPHNIQFDWINRDDPEDYYVDNTDFLNFCHPIVGDYCLCPLDTPTCNPAVYDEAAMTQHGVNTLGLDPQSTLLVFIPEYATDWGDWPWLGSLGTYHHGILIPGSHIGGLECPPTTGKCQALTHEVGHTLGLYHTY